MSKGISAELKALNIYFYAHIVVAVAWYLSAIFLDLISFWIVASLCLIGVTVCLTSISSTRKTLTKANPLTAPSVARSLYTFKWVSWANSMAFLACAMTYSLF